MSTVVGDAVVQIKAMTAGLSTQLAGVKNTFTQAAQSSQAAWGGVMQTIGGLGMAMGLKSMMDAAGEQLKAEKRLKAMLDVTGNTTGFTIGQLREMANGLQDVTNFGDEAGLAAMQLMARFEGLSGDVFKDVLHRAADLAEIMQMDLPAAANMLGRAMQNPVRGMMLLQRAGVPVTEQLREQVKSLVEAGRLEEARRLLLDKMPAKGFAEAVASPFKQLKNLAGDAMEAIGMLVLPMVRAAQQIFRPLFQSISALRDQFEGVGKKVGDMVKQWIADNRNLVNGLMVLVGALIAVKGAIFAIGLAMKIVSMSNPFTAIIAGAFMLASAFVDWGDVIEWVITLSQNMELVWRLVLDEITVAAIKAVQGIVGFFWGGVNAIVSLFQAMGTNVGAMFQGIGDSFVELGSLIRDVWNDLWSGDLSWDTFTERAEAANVRLMETLRSRVVNLGDAFAEGWNRGWDDVRDTVFADQLDAIQAERDFLRNELARRHNTRLAGRRQPQAPGANAAAAIPQEVIVKFESVGFIDMWKRVQESLGGQAAEQIAARTLTASERTNEILTQTNSQLATIAEGVRMPRPAIASGGPA